MMALLMAMKMVKAKVKKKDQWKDLNSDDDTYVKGTHSGLVKY